MYLSINLQKAIYKPSENENTYLTKDYDYEKENHPNRHVALFSNFRLPCTHIDTGRGRHHHRDTIICHHTTSDTGRLRFAL